MNANLTALPEFAPRAAAAEVAGREVDTAMIGHILRRRRWTVALSGLAAFSVAALYCLTATPQYVALAQILIDPRDKQVVSNDVNPSAIAADGGVTQVESQGSVLLSNGVLSRAIAATHLEADPEFNGAGFFARLLRLGGSSDPGWRTAETLQNLRRHAAYKRADKVLVLDLTVRANTPDKAAEIANAIADAYLADQTEARADSSRDASKSLTGRLGELQADVKTAETAVEDYRAENNLVVSTGQLVSDQEINQTTAQLASADSRVSSLKAQLDQLRRQPGGEGTPEAMASGAMVRLRDRESGIVEKLASAEKQLGPLHPEIGSLRQSLADVRALIAREAQRLRQAAEADYARAVDDDRALRARLDTMKTRSLADDKTDVRLRELQRQADAARSIYQSFLVRAKETLEAANVDTTNARVITRALPPLQKSWPPTSLLLLGAGLGGLCFGAAGAIAREHWRPTLMTAAQAGDIVSLPVLGVVAALELAVAATPRPGSQKRGAAAAVRATLQAAEAGETSPLARCLVVAATPGAAGLSQRFAEKLAAVAARQGRRALVIDGDAREGAQADPPGLLDILRGDCSVADVARRDADVPFARLGKGRPDPEDWAAPEGTEAFRLRRLRRSYDLIVIDAGAASENARLAAFAGQTPYTVLLVALGEPQSALLGEAESAAEASLPLGGLVVIDPEGRV